MKKLTLNAPAKINIGLNVVSKRDDGFHNLETLFYPIFGLYDTLVFESCNNFIFDSNNSDLVKDPNNLIIKAHTLLQDLTKMKLPLCISLTKNIPIGAGLGGGSSNAATTLVGLIKFFDLDINFGKLNELALQLGSDVPFFIKSKPAIGYSRGEILKQTNTIINYPILIINPGIHISTKEAFSNIIPKEAKFNYKYFLNNEELDFSFLMENIENDFETYVFDKYPKIKEIKQTLIESNSLFSIMSGTGSTIYGVFPDYQSAEAMANKYKNNYFTFISK